MFDKLDPDIRKFILWKDDLNCKFSLHYNGISDKKERITYDKGDSNYTIDEVFEYWQKNVRK
jgi:hypothetical protein